MAGLIISFVCCIFPVFLVPLITASQLFRMKTDSVFPRFAAWLIVKPLWTTPLWLICISFISPYKYRTELEYQNTLWALAGLSVGVIGTLVLLYHHREIFRERRGGAIAGLLLLDAARWMNSFGGVMTQYSITAGSTSILFALLGLTLPSIFAFVAYTIAREAY
jgi:hypothetical protein